MDMMALKKAMGFATKTEEPRKDEVHERVNAGSSGRAWVLPLQHCLKNSCLSRTGQCLRRLSPADTEERAGGWTGKFYGQV